MSTAIAFPCAQPSSAHAWFQAHYLELRNRAQRFARRFPRGRRPDAVAEILGQIWRYVLGATDRGKLARLTPFSLVSFFGRSYAAGRRLCSTRSTDVLSDGKRQPRIASLDQPRIMRTPDGFRCLPLSQVLADRRVSSPLELTRLNVDYPCILRRHKANRRARQVFAWLAETQGDGRQIDLARELGVSPPRIVALKQRLARCLAAGGYGPAERREA